MRFFWGELKMRFFQKGEEGIKEDYLEWFSESHV